MFLTFFTESGSSLSSMILPIIMIAILGGMIFFSSRSSKKEARETQNMLNNLQVGDEITTIGGIIGKIVSIKEETCVIETSRDCSRIRILKSAVRTVDVKAEDAQD